MSIDVIDPSEPWDEEERKVRARRIEMYSVRAIAVGREVTRKYILFPGLKSVLSAFDRVYQLSRDLRLPQGVLLSGPPGSSKTSVADYFMKSLPLTSDVVEGYGCLYLRMRPNTSAGFIVSQLLGAVKHPFTTVRADRVAPMRDIAIEALQHRGTRLIFVDEAQCLALRNRGRVSDDRDTSAGNMLREVMDRAYVALVLLADQRLQRLEEVDGALADRVSVRISLAHFANDGDWGGFLAELARGVKSIDLGALGAEPLRAKLHGATSGCRRASMRLITEATLVAVDAGAASVNEGHVHLAFQRTNGPGHVVANPFSLN